MSAPTPLADVMITLGARDLVRLRAFYRAVGWPEIIDDDNFAAFDVHGGVLALFPRTEFAPKVIVDTPDQVDELTEQMRAAGARVTKEPIDAEFFVGRSAYLCDPEDNYFEITWAEPTNPIMSRRVARA